MRPISSVCVYAASSERIHVEHLNAARELGEILAEASVRIVYGGGSVGSMGALADGALARGGEVVGVMPRFMQELEWGHQGLAALHIVEHLHERKLQMVQGADAIVALPGGSGTLEELLEAITWKRLGLFLGPIVLVNVRGTFDKLNAVLEALVVDGFMDARHRDMWRTVGSPSEVVEAIMSAPEWSADSRSFATVRRDGAARS